MANISPSSPGISSLAARAAAPLLFLSCGGVLAQQGGGSNMFQNVDMGRAIQVEVLWDGVDSKSKLRVPTYNRMAATMSGKVTGVPMPASPAVGDVTGDDLADLLVGDGLGYIWVFKNVGTKEAPKFTGGEILPIWLFHEERWGGYQLHAGWERDYPRYVPRIHLTDWDANREPDLVVGTFFGEVYHVPLNISGGQIAVPNGTPANTEINVRQQGEFWANFFTPFVWDWNGDGAKDLVLGEGTYSCNAVYVLFNTGSNSGPRFKPEERKVLLWGDGREQLKPLIVDWDNDGNADLLVCDYSGAITLHPNKGTHKDLKEPLPSEGTPIQIGSQKSFGSLCCPAIGDLNGDGLFDIVIGKSDGTLHYAYNTGKAGAPKFDKLQQFEGADIYPAVKRPVYWTDNHMRSGFPYHVVEQFNDPANTAGPGRSGGDCVRLRFVQPKQVVAKGKFPAIGSSVKDFVNIMRYESRAQLFVGKRYEISFWIRREGFTTCEWYIWGEEWEKQKTRRGEEMQWYGKKRLSVHQIREDVAGGGWRFIKKSFVLPGKIKNNDMNHIFWILTTGTGEVCVDDISFREI